MRRRGIYIAREVGESQSKKGTMTQIKLQRIEWASWWSGGL